MEDPDTSNGGQSESNPFEGDDVEPFDVDLEQIVAAHIAINPERRAWRSDILVTTLVEILRSGDLSRRRLHERLNAALKTRTVTGPVFSQALENAAAAGLVVEVTDLSGTARWQLTTDARLAAQEDRDWAERIYRRFEEDVVEGLRDAGVDLKRDRGQKAAQHLLRALSAGADAYGVEDGLDGLLRPISFDGTGVRRSLSPVQPRSVRDALFELADAAVDPDDPFGNELIHLLVVSNLLHGFATRRDVPEAARLSSTRICIDTSVLVHIVAVGQPERDLLLQMIELSQRAGVEIIVTQHTLEEWDRLWDAAERQRPDTLGDGPVDPLTYRLADNPFAAEFLRRRASDRSLSWGRFVATTRDVRPELDRLGIIVRPAGNDRPEDREVVEQATALLRDFSADPSIGGRRTRSGAEADAETCAMIRRWRLARGGQGHCPAYFIANEQLTGRAYRELFPDDARPLVVNAAGWTAYVGALVTEDPEARAALAELVSSAVVRQTMFAVATSYTIDEAVTLARMLAGHDRVSPTEARAALQLNFDELVEDASGRSPDKVRSAAIQLQTARSQRQSARARRERSIGEQAQRDAEALIQESTAANEAKLAEKEAELARLRQSLETTEPAQPLPAPPTTDSLQTRTAAFAVTLVLLGVVAGSAAGLVWADGKSTPADSTFAPWVLARSGFGALGIIALVLASVSLWHGLVKSEHDFVRTTFLGRPARWGALLAAGGALLSVFALG